LDARPIGGGHLRRPIAKGGRVITPAPQASAIVLLHAASRSRALQCVDHPVDYPTEKSAPGE